MRTEELTYLNRLRGETYGPHTLPVGSKGNIAAVLVNAAKGAGVDIRTDAKVQQIIVADGKAAGIRLLSGEEIMADIVISNADAKTTFLDLVGTADLDAMFAHRVHTTRTNGSVAKLHFALSGLPRVNGLPETELGQRHLVHAHRRRGSNDFPDRLYR